MKQRKHTSRIWEISREDLLTRINAADTLEDVLVSFGFCKHGGGYTTLRARCNAENIDLQALVDRGKQARIQRSMAAQQRKLHLNLHEMLVENATHTRGNIKRRLLLNGLLVEQCALCGLLPIWQGKALTLVLDHINGVANDYRLENLRLLCPNCNSQTDTFTGRNKKNVNRIRRLNW